MSKMENVKLPLSILSALYKNVLIDEKLTPSEPENKIVDAIIVLCESEAEISSYSSALLQGILNACKLNAVNSAVFTAKPESNTTIQTIKEKLITKKIILFGVSPTAFGLPVAFPHFQIQHLDGIQYIYSPSLDELLSDKSLKILLWNCLKQVFA